MRTHLVRRPGRRLPDPLLHLRRHPRARLALSVVLLAAAALLAQRSLAAGAAERDAWGRSVVVAVATRDIEPGEELAGAVELRPVPAALVPDHPLESTRGRRVARVAIYEGEVVVADRVAPNGLSGVAALLPAGHRAVAVPVDESGAPPLGVGDHVDVLVSLDPTAAGEGPPGFAVAEAALVVDVADGGVTLAVERAAAPRVAYAVTQGLVTLALVGE